MDSLSASKRVGIMGGSFDPVHNGHLIIARDAVDQLNLDKVVFIPASIPPHKQHLKKEDARYRLKMLQLAVGDAQRMSVSDIEIQRGGVSYTIDTVKELRSDNPDYEFILIVGSDTLTDLHNWYKIYELLDICHVASFMRPGECDIDQIKKKVMLSSAYKERLISETFKTHLVEISSTEIRDRVKENQGISALVPATVENFIYENNLYQG